MDKKKIGLATFVLCKKNVAIYIRNCPIPYVNINGEKGHFATFVYEMGGVPIFKIMRKECIFERFSIQPKKNSENMSFQFQKLLKLE